MNRLKLDFGNNAILRDGKVIATITAVDTCAEKDIEEIFDTGTRLSNEDIESLWDLMYDLNWGVKYASLRSKIDEYRENDGVNIKFMEQVCQVVDKIRNLEIKG